MKCITIEHEVDAYETEWLLNLSKQDWSKLPTWFKNMHQENKLFVGGSKIQLETEHFRVEADKNDVIFLKPDGFVDVMPKDKFYKTYRDIFSIPNESHPNVSSLK
ncbi:hypothetical protein [Acinetobacter nosocomialis]|uniref:hypothetical protein n=1 Tax=Acinetobacter nosocomialis TaxID=106654 RepID=UPI001B842A86|nr:hypothetical protein [Acinetobacter nosocomialis]MBR7715521.1 hypothetical protein [Acinetobacter nosocomialis]